MITLIAARAGLARRGLLTPGVTGGIAFWSSMYIPIIVAMAATQDVVAAIGSGPVVILASLISFVLCLGVAAALSRSRLGVRPERAPEPATEGVL